MSEATAQAAAHPPAPLVALTEDEMLFRDTVRQFADESVRPHVKEMDEKGVFEHSLIDQFFELGLMGIEVPEQYGGGGGTFFEAILAVEELSRVDPSAGVVVDVQNTLVNNALLHWTTEEQKKRYLPRMCKDTVGAYALSEAGSGSDAFALADARRTEGQRIRAQRAEDVDHQRQGSGRLHPAGHGRSVGGLQRHHGVHRGERASPASPSARKKTSWAFARRVPAS